jgi:hypothetical protein
LSIALLLFFSFFFNLRFSSRFLLRSARESIGGCKTRDDGWFEENRKVDRSWRERLEKAWKGKGGEGKRRRGEGSMDRWDGTKSEEDGRRVVGSNYPT